METNAGGTVMKRVLLAMFIILFFNGCNGPEGAWYFGEKGERRFFESRHYKPVLYSWYKDGVSSEETRMQDWIECGGAESGNFSPYIGDLEKEKSQMKIIECKPIIDFKQI
jgi:hypothetical protein